MAKMFVKVAAFGGKVQEVCLDEGATLEDALKAAEMSSESMEVTVNNREAELEDEVFDKDIVVLSPKVSGG
ncbi:MAG TPA: thiamine biosynthesis protein ThiS [Spirochaetia bacterium]|nr:thiamine biosynthesis protein ThiS [Spirochaetia bacterium]